MARFSSCMIEYIFFFSSRRLHTRWPRDWSSDVCSSDLALIFTQIWFVIMALVAPFALLIASFPSQFNVVKRYFFELSLPLLIKIGLHFVLVVIIFLTDVGTSAMTDLTSDFFDGHFGSAFVMGLFYFLLFIGIFLLRKRIMSALSSGSEMMGEIRQGLSSVTTEPIKQGVQGGATVAGATAGALVAGTHGAMVGANIGSTAGNVATGNTDMAGATQDVTRSMYQGKMLSHLGEHQQGEKEEKDNQEQPSPNVGGSGVNRIPNSQHNNEETEEKQEYEASEQTREYEVKQQQQERERVFNILDDFDLGEYGKEQFIDHLNKQGIDFSKINRESVQRQLDKGYNFDNPEELAEQMKKHQIRENQRKEKIKHNRRRKFEDFLSGQNLNVHEKQKIFDFLNEQGIDFAHIPDYVYRDINEDIFKKMETEEVDYADEFNERIRLWRERRNLEEQVDTENEQVDTGEGQEHNGGMPTGNLE